MRLRFITRSIFVLLLANMCVSCFDPPMRRIAEWQLKNDTDSVLNVTHLWISPKFVTMDPGDTLFLYGSAYPDKDVVLSFDEISEYKSIFELRVYTQSERLVKEISSAATTEEAQKFFDQNYWSSSSWEEKDCQYKMWTYNLKPDDL